MVIKIPSHEGNILFSDKVAESDLTNFKLENAIALLARIPRWTGHTVVNYTVLHHSLAVHQLSMRLGYDNGTQVLALFHDLAEAYTGDIPRPLKTQDQSEIEHVIWNNIAYALGLGTFHSDQFEDLKKLDLAILNAEAVTLLTPPMLQGFFALDGTPSLDKIHAEAVLAVNNIVSMSNNLVAYNQFTGVHLPTSLAIEEFYKALGRK